LNLNTAIAYELSVLLAKAEITHLHHKILNLSKRAKFIDYLKKIPFIVRGQKQALHLRAFANSIIPLMV
jgi:hypothetical protein